MAFCKCFTIIYLASIVCLFSQSMGLSPADPSSFSRPDIASITHIDLIWNVDFSEKILRGSAELHFDVLKNTWEIILDVRNLSISSIKSSGEELKYIVSDDTPNFGEKLTVKLNEEATSGSKLKILVEYTTSRSATALQWLEAEQTSGKEHPYMFSQCQPIHARSLLPCQDSPAVKFTYTASVTAPTELTVLMSALRTAPRAAGEATLFRQPVPIPSYLLAIATGCLESKVLGPRSLVWSEKNELEKSAWEFANTESYLQAAEKLCGEYVWTEYNLLVLPPSFPYGGMENPCLTFVTPTLLAGDRSQADVIIHEIMHSWSGNLVTNNNFEHFWLNEGFTVFLERKVAASLIADKESSRKARDFESILGLQELSDVVYTTLGKTNPLTCLVVNLTGVHPDDAFSDVPYEKGSLFLRYIEDLVGGQTVFDEFLRAYFQHYKMKSINTDDFKSFLLKYFAERGNTALDNVDWPAWLRSPGMPPIIPEYDTTLSKECKDLVDRIHSEPTSSLSPRDIEGFSPHQVIFTLQELIDRDPLPLDKLKTVGSLYNFSASRNSEILFRWQRLSIRSRDVGIVGEVLEFLNYQGRMKYVRPLYRELYAWEEMRQRAIDNFLAHEPEMMHVVSYVVRQDLHLNQ